jgi:glycogen debranching enzyme
MVPGKASMAPAIYFYMAKVRLASLLDRAGDRKIASRLIRDAHELKRKFNRDFWMSEKGFYVQAATYTSRRNSSTPAMPVTGIVDATGCHLVKRY